MLRKLIIFGICAGSSASLPILYQSNPEAVMTYLASSFSKAPEEMTTTVEIDPAVLPRQNTGGRRVSIERNDGGHFVSDFKFNGRKIEAMVDTGATVVAVNLSTARRIGVPVTQADMKQTVRTANGETRAAIVTIERLDIGRISVNNVQAIVLDDSALGGALIGMSFLNRLNKYEVDGTAMVLTQ